MNNIKALHYYNPRFYKIPVGYYRVKIECENDDFKKLFSFSKNQTYTDRSLYQALKYQKQYDIKIELNQDLLYNAYLYNDNDLDKGSDIFIKWFDIVKDLKQKFPDNQIIKFIASSTHGQIEAKYIIYKTQQEVNDEKLDIGVMPHNRYFVDDIMEYGIYGTSSF